MLRLYTYFRTSAAYRVRSGTVASVPDKVILLSDCNKDDKPKVETLLRATRDRSGVIQLNRLIADLLSFMQAVLIARGRGAVEAACRRIDGDLDASLAVLHPQLVKCLSIECEPKVATNELWLSWLDAIDRDTSLDYVPCHLLLPRCRTMIGRMSALAPPQSWS